MDTRDQTLTKLTWLHGKSHPTHHRPASLWWDYSCTAVSIMKLLMEDGWWWRRRWIPLFRAPNRLQISPPERDYGLAEALYRKTRWNFLSDFFFSPNMNIRSWNWRWWSSRGPTRQGARPRGPPPLWIGCGPPDVDSFANIFYLFQKFARWIFRSFWELLFLHKNNTMAVLLKTASVRVSSIQIMQVRVQNKGKSVWKSRYDGDVSWV